MLKWQLLLQRFRRGEEMQKSILIVDDDENLSYIISDILGHYGYNVSMAKDSKAAFTLLSENIYHLILLDINLPDHSEFAFCEELREVSTVPVIFASARTSEIDRIAGFDIGGDDYLPEPYSMKELLYRVNALIRRTYGFSEKERVVSNDLFIHAISDSDKLKISMEKVALCALLREMLCEISMEKQDIRLFLTRKKSLYWRIKTGLCRYAKILSIMPENMQKRK